MGRAAHAWPGLTPVSSLLPGWDKGPVLLVIEQELLAWLDEIPGVNRRMAEVIVAEVGVNMKAFPTASHLVSWAGLSPGNNESAGK